MPRWKQHLDLALFSTLPAIALAAPKPATPLRCPAEPVTVQVLGSSGPIAEGIGAAASYLAGEVAPRRLVLAHNMKRSLDRLDEGTAAIRTHYKGPLVVAHDLDCYGLGK
jgi:hypothetical protein